MTIPRIISNFLQMPYIYLLYRNGKVKVGYSSDPNRRSVEARGKLVFCWRHPFAHNIEQKAHRLLQKWNSPNAEGSGRTEWYQPRLKDRAIFTALFFAVWMRCGVGTEQAAFMGFLIGFWFAPVWMGVGFFLLISFLWSRIVFGLVAGLAVLDYLI